MKINSSKTRNYKLFKHNLLKLQIYSNKNSVDIFNFSETTLEQLESYLKQVLKIVYEYHINHFKILFIGFPVVSKLKHKKLIHFTNHNFISEKLWVSGIFRNRFSILTYLNLIQSQNFSESLKLLLSVKTKPDLVVIFNQNVEMNAINEFYKTRIPILSFNVDFSNISKITYNVFGNFNFNKKSTKMTYFFLFHSLLKKIPFSKKFQQ